MAHKDISKDKTFTIDCAGYAFRFERRVKGVYVDHLLFRSVNAGYLISFTSIDEAIRDINNRVFGAPGKRVKKSY